ncbi:uncharacterized protein LOC112558235 isoform X2 [Pomacea canaliculata]|nr:uncharacterized protein LOC112558235 isoform X2 [Pomacea canaliculata]
MMSETVDELVMARRRMEHQKLINELHRTNNILGISLLVTSLTAVLMAMVVYSCFVTLQCVRVTLIKNLLVSVLFQGHFTLILQVLLFMARTENLPDTRCFFKRTSFCEAIISGQSSSS